MNILSIFFICLTIVELCFAQTLDTETMNNYLRAVQDGVLSKVKDYGLSNLPDDDIEMNYDIDDGLSYDIKGTLYLEDGFVKSLDNIEFIHQGKTRNIVGNGQVKIETYIGFEGLSFHRDFRFEPNGTETIPDQTVGSVIITPEKFYFDIMIAHYIVDDYVNCTMSSVYQGQTSKKALDFYPKNILTTRLRKEYWYGAPIFPTIGEAWQPIFEPILNEVVLSIPFPALDFPVDRNYNKD